MSAPQSTEKSEKSAKQASNDRAAIITAVCLALVVAALVVVFVHVHSVSRSNKNAGSSYDLTTAQHAALTAASTEAVNVLSFSRKTFAADFARALAGATGPLLSDLTGKKSATQSALSQGKFDLSAKVATPAAYIGLTDNGKQLLVLVTVNGYKVADDSSLNSSSVQRLELTMQLVHGRWLAAGLNAVGIQ
jgi:hypothetical protein